MCCFSNKTTTNQQTFTKNVALCQGLVFLTINIRNDLQSKYYQILTSMKCCKTFIEHCRRDTIIFNVFFLLSLVFVVCHAFLFWLTLNGITYLTGCKYSSKFKVRDSCAIFFYRPSFHFVPNLITRVKQGNLSVIVMQQPNIVSGSTISSMELILIVLFTILLQNNQVSKQRFYRDGIHMTSIAWCINSICSWHLAKSYGRHGT